jgi:thioredoxin reductase
LGCVPSQPWDTIIIGGGPAGLSAALALGRCRRRVLVCDAGLPRNRHSNHLHAYLTRDGFAPAEFLEIARQQLAAYDTVRLVKGEAVDVRRDKELFEVSVAESGSERARTLLLATGVVDHVPPIPGIEPLYGKSVHHCPYCDAWEWRDQPIAVYGRGDAKGAGLALMMLQWSSDVVLVTDGPSALSPDERERLDQRGIRVHEDPIARLEGDGDGRLQRIVFGDGRALARAALFFNTGQHQRSRLAEALGCEFDERGGVVTGELDVLTCVPGVYVAGDASRDVQLVVVAAAEGVKAAFAINKRLLADAGLA